jgi:hypothetical protein
MCVVQLINIVTKRASAYSFQGEVKAIYKNQYFNSYEGETNFRLSTPKMAFDLMYDAHDSKAMQHFTMNSHHTYQNKLYDISQTEWGRSKGWNHSLRAAYEYNISDKSHFNIAYNSFISPSGHAANDVSGSYQTSHLDKHDRNYLHNVSAAYQSAVRAEAWELIIPTIILSITSTSRAQLGRRTITFYINGGQDVQKISLICRPATFI